MPRLKSVLIWLAVLAAVSVPLVAAAGSPLLAWRQPIYIISGFAGIAALALLLLQPLLAAGLLPGLAPLASKRWHRICGLGLVLAVVTHVAGLWITSPPDVIDALTFTSPTPFSAWGVIAMWTVFAAALLAVFRRRLRIKVTTWRRVHVLLAVVTVVGTVVHALLIEGTMETFTKIALCIIVIAVTARAIFDLRLWQLARRKKRGRTWRPQ
ncbi:MAG: ferric reductase-like transmembrane domain-containing protein [Pseudomonadota bacterium]